MNRRLLSAMLVVLLLAASAGTGFYLQNQRQANTPPPAAITAKAHAATAPVTPGVAAPDFSLPDLEGDKRSLSEWRGEVVVVNFWATWCPPCREEIPAFVALQSQYGEQGVQFIGIALQQARELTDFVAEYHINYPILVGESEVIRLAQSLGNTVGGLPYTVIIDRAGAVQFVKAGPLTRQQAEAAITALL